MKNNSFIVLIVATLVIGVGSFYGGMQYQKSQRGNFQQFGINGTRRFMMGQGDVGAGVSGMGNGQAVRGEVLSRDEKTVTIKLQDGSTKLVLLSTGTAITESTIAGETALSEGKQVMVFGTTNSDGSVSAQNVLIGEIGGFGGRMGGVRPTGGQPTQ